ncbi:MAG: hypothetical protein ACREA2_04815 [Blastocatellia bacterium]
MTCAAMLIAGLLIAFTLGTPAQSPALPATLAQHRGVAVMLEIRVVSGGRTELICHRAQIGVLWSKELETGKTYEITPASVNTGLNEFTPRSTRVDGPKRDVNFSGRGNPNIVGSFRSGGSCPL